MTDEIDYTNGSALDLETVSKDMISSFKDSLGVHWTKVRPEMEKHIQEVQESINYISVLQAEEKITKEAAEELMEFQKLNMKMLMLEFDGMKDIAIETAINAAFKKVREAVNRLVNFELL